MQVNHSVKKSGCLYQGQCFLAFNSVLGGREIRFDFSLCNLSCILCWANNDAKNSLITSQELLDRFLHCICQKDAYIQKRYPDGIENTNSFKTSALQIVGGETLLNKSRFLFVYEFLHSLNEKIQQHSVYLKINKLKRFKVKIFTNGVSIGLNEVTLQDIYSLDCLGNLDIRILLSIKGLNEKNTEALQAKTHPFSVLDLQARALEILLENRFRSIKIEPVLGFYHSCDFNIKAPGIAANEMFTFSECDAASKKLQKLLASFKSEGGAIFVEPVHSVPQTPKGKNAFYEEYQDFLEMDTLIERDLKGGSRRNLAHTKLYQLI